MRILPPVEEEIRRVVRGARLEAALEKHFQRGFSHNYVSKIADKVAREGLTFECIWQNETDAKTYFMGPQAQAMSLIATNTDVAITGGNPIFNITLAQCQFTELGRPFKVKDLVYQSIKFKASYNIANTIMGEVIVTNSLSAGY